MARERVYSAAALAERACARTLCGKVFQPRHPLARYCSVSCRTGAYHDRGGERVVVADPRLDALVGALIELGEEPGRTWTIPGAFREAARRAGIPVPLGEAEMVRVVGGAA